jgi:hypothetical protein
MLIKTANVTAGKPDYALCEMTKQQVERPYMLVDARPSMSRSKDWELNEQLDFHARFCAE